MRSVNGWVGQRQAELTLAGNNLFNQTLVTDSAGRVAVGASGPLLVNVLARLNYMLSFRSDL